MKKLATAVEAIGMMLAFVSMCFEPTEEPILIIPILAGFALLCAGVHIEMRWEDEEEIKNLINHDCFCDGTDDGITYITYDSSGEERYMDSERVSTLYK